MATNETRGQQRSGMKTGQQRRAAAPPPADDLDEVEEVDNTEEENEPEPAPAPQGRRQAAPQRQAASAPPTRQPQGGKAPQRAQQRQDDDDMGDGDGGNDEVINLGDTEEASGAYEVMPAGKYRCTVDSTEFKVFKTGSKGMVVVLEVAEGPHSADGRGTERGALLFTNVVFSLKGAGILKHSLRALGVSEKIYNHGGFTPRMLQKLADSGDLIGNPVIAQVNIRNYEGEKRNNVRSLIHPKDAAGDDEVASGGGDFLDD